MATKAADREDRSDNTGTTDEHWVVKASRFVAEPLVRTTRDLSYGDHPRLRYDLYEPPPSTAVTATAHFIYGGSWETGERGCYQHVGAALAMQGIRTVIADYRLHPDVSFPDFVEDMAKAYAHIARTYADDAASPVVVGHSAGAHIGALMCGDPEYLARVGLKGRLPSAFVGMSGPYVFDPTTWGTTKHIFTTIADTPNKARPITFASRDFPPTLLVHGGRDTLVTPNASEIMHNALLAAGAQSELKVYPHLAHAGPIAVIAKPMRWLAPVLKSVTAFIVSESKKRSGSD